jgi:hypothetical protein
MMNMILGYDPNANPPNYGKPDDVVLQKTNEARNKMCYSFYLSNFQVHANGAIWYEKAVKAVNDPSRVDRPIA